MSEKDVQKIIMDWCGWNRYYVLRLNSGMIRIFENNKYRMIRMCPAGTPDLLILINGNYIFVEVKKDDKEVQKWKKKIEKYLATSYIPPSHNREIAQYKAHRKIAKAGGKTLIVGSLNELESDLKKLNLI